MTVVKNPIISVIVSCYKCGDRLSKCLESLLGQTLKNIEVICIDDKSPDNTSNIIKSYANRDNRIVPIYNKKNIGVSASRNKGIEIAGGDYIMFCDADDYYSPSACEEMLNSIEKNNADLAINEINVIYEAHSELKYSDSKYYSLKFSGLKLVSEEVILNIDYSPTNKIFRKNILKKNMIRFPEGLYYEDAYFCLAYLCCSNTIFFLNKCLYHYIRHEDSIMSNTFSKQSAKDYSIDHLYIMFKVYDFLDANGLSEKYNMLFWKLYYLYELAALNNSKTKENTKLIRATSKDFVARKSTSFYKADLSTQSNIRDLNSSWIRISKTKIKKLLIKSMPAYRLQVSTVQRLKALVNKASQMSK